MKEGFGGVSAREAESIELKSTSFLLQKLTCVVGGDVLSSLWSVLVQYHSVRQL